MVSWGLNIACESLGRRERNVAETNNIGYGLRMPALTRRLHADGQRASYHALFGLNHASPVALRVSQGSATKQVHSETARREARTPRSK